MNHRIEALAPSASVSLMGKAKELQKKDPSIIGLAGGEPDFTTPDKIRLAAMKSLIDGDTHYEIGPGLPELRKAIQTKLLRENNIEVSADNILVTPGGKNAIYLAINAVLNEGDEVIVLDPAWVSYEPIIRAAGGKTVKLKLDYDENYRITAEALEKAVSPKTRMLIINYPNNPTGRILHEEEALVLEKFMKAYPEIYLLSDEIYERIVFDGKKSISMAAYSSIKDKVITVNGFSKSVAMTGWRMGYMASSSEVFKVAYKLYQHSLTCMSGFLQRGAVQAFECNSEISEMCESYEQRRDMFVGALNDIKKVSCRLPEGSFYAWVKFDLPGMTSMQVSEYLLEDAGVVAMPGSAYGEEKSCCMRFSFANNYNDLKLAAERIKISIDKLK